MRKIPNELGSQKRNASRSLPVINAPFDLTIYFIYFIYFTHEQANSIHGCICGINTALHLRQVFIQPYNCCDKVMFDDVKYRH
jgi:hypothetical protein